MVASMTGAARARRSEIELTHYSRVGVLGD